MISAKIVADSLAPNGVRLTTLSLVYPRFIHSEFMTHRVFSRNAASSRAIPIIKVLGQLRLRPAIPVHWGKNQKGMQADEELSAEQQAQALQTWLEARDDAMKHASRLEQIGVHKQVTNRLSEPFALISTLVTATEWDNFFNLRADKMAQPEFRVLAEAMLDAMNDWQPLELGNHDWHLPYVSEDEAAEHDNIAPKLSVARCARVSYNNHDTDKPPKIEDDVVRHDDLLKSGHLSPFEHQAVPLKSADEWSSNFRGWKQYRKMLANPFEATSPKLKKKYNLTPEEKLWMAILKDSTEIRGPAEEVVDILKKRNFSSNFIHAYMSKYHER